MDKNELILKLHNTVKEDCPVTIKLLVGKYSALDDMEIGITHVQVCDGTIQITATMI